MKWRWRVYGQIRNSGCSDHEQWITFYVKVEDKCHGATLSYSGTQPGLITRNYGSNGSINFDNYINHNNPHSGCPLERILEWYDQENNKWTATNSNTWVNRSSGTANTVTFYALTSSSSAAYKTNPMHEEQFRMRYISTRSI